MSMNSDNTPTPVGPALSRDAPSDDDASNGGYPYRPSQYQREIEDGTRLPNGQKPLRRLTKQHRRIIELHLEGKRNRDICLELNCAPATVSRVIYDPLAQYEIERAAAESRMRLEALQHKAIDVAERALSSESIDNGLKGVDRWIKLKELFGGGQKEKTAEDIIAAIIGQVNISVTNNQGGSNDAETNPNLLEGQYSRRPDDGERE